MFVMDMVEIARLIQIFFSHYLVFFGGRYNGSGYTRQGIGEGGGQILMQYFCMCTVHQCSHTGVAVLHSPAKCTFQEDPMDVQNSVEAP